MLVSCDKENVARISAINDTRPGSNAMANVTGPKKGRSYKTRTGVWLLAAVSLSGLLSSHVALAEPEPAPPGMYYAESLRGDPESLLLLKRLRLLVDQERELTEEEIAIQAMLEAKERGQRIGIPPVVQREYDDEIYEKLPEPSGRTAGKRTSYMALCHFKICNMGRKRQSISEMRARSLPLSTWLALSSRTTAIRLPRP